ncbi:hypothetical protein QE152_g37612 [Popillia japonica]|uniref:Ty3-gypsy retrotransposon protein n=1 Tax=Popillia japonica TaxID=7064 RepID=A0AAW1I947_POPJA
MEETISQKDQKKSGRTTSIEAVENASPSHKIEKKDQKKSGRTTSIEAVENASPSHKIENLDMILEAMEHMTEELKIDIDEVRQQNKQDIHSPIKSLLAKVLLICTI